MRIDKLRKTAEALQLTNLRVVNYDNGETSLLFTNSAGVLEEWDPAHDWRQFGMLVEAFRPDVSCKHEDVRTVVLETVYSILTKHEAST